MIIQVPQTKCYTNRNSLLFIFGELPTRPVIVVMIKFYTYASLFQNGSNLPAFGVQQIFSFLAFINRNDHNLNRSDPRWQNQSLIITMRHYQGTYQAGAYAPTGCPYIFQFILLIRKFHIESLCKILAEKMRSAGLKCFSILHHSFYTIRVNSSSKSFAGGFHSPDNRNRHIIFYKICINS